MKSAIVKVLFIALISLNSFAGYATGKDTTGVATSTKSSKKALTAEEVKFYQEIENYYQEEIAGPANAIAELEEVKQTKLEVYDLSGKLLHSQDKGQSPINLDLLPKGAKFFVTEGDTRIYLVL